MKRRIFASLAATAAVAASILITGVTPAAAQPALADSNTAARSPRVTPNEGLPAEIKITAADGNLTVVATLLGVGKQVYDCQAGNTYKLREPVAGLFTSRGIPAGIHGAGPFWASFDGSRVIGNPNSPLSKSVPPPPNSPKGVNWLKVAVDPGNTFGQGGVFSKVKFIQRIDTRGGVAPATCGAPTVAVDYTTNYVFWAQP